MKNHKGSIIATISGLLIVGGVATGAIQYDNTIDDRIEQKFKNTVSQSEFDKALNRIESAANKMVKSNRETNRRIDNALIRMVSRK